MASRRASKARLSAFSAAIAAAREAELFGLAGEVRAAAGAGRGVCEREREEEEGGGEGGVKLGE